MFLFQLLCISGEWDKALTQLRALAQLSPEAQNALGRGTLLRAIEAGEVPRSQVFKGSRPPCALLGVSSSTWAERPRLAPSRPLCARPLSRMLDALRDKAFEAAPETPGDLNGTPFDWIADGDARFGPALEAIIAGQWGLLPFDAVEKIQSEGPRDLRDIVWLPAQVFFKTGQSVAALLPARYPGSESSPDASLRLTRGTDWVDQPWGQAGIGQHEWSLSGGEDVGILSLRRLAFT